MSLLTYVCLLLAITTVHPSCDWGNWNYAKVMFNSLSNEVINYDHDIQQTCQHFKQYSAREVFGDTGFRLEIMCNGFENANWDLMVKHRVIYINGHYPRPGQTCDLTYVDIKVLPSFVDTHNGVWIYNNGMLMVAFPYKYTLFTHPVPCSQNIDETLIYVRKGFPNDRIFIDGN